MQNNFIQVVVLAVVRQNDTYLLTKRNDETSDFHGKWQIAGGGLEFGETPEETLHREVKEELGTEIKIIHSEPFVDTEIRGKWQGIFITYVCELKDINSTINLNEEASEFGWFTKEEMESLDLLPGCVELIKKIEHL